MTQQIEGVLTRLPDNQDAVETLIILWQTGLLPDFVEICGHTIGLVFNDIQVARKAWMEVCYSELPNDVSKVKQFQSSALFTVSFSSLIWREENGNSR